MSIRVLYFASLKESVGRAEDCLAAVDGITVLALWQQLNPDLPLPASVLAAVNMHYVDLGTMVQDGDEVGFFPPVTGG